MLFRSPPRGGLLPLRLRRRRQRPGDQQVEDPAPADVKLRLVAAVGEDVGVLAAGVLQRVGQNGHRGEVFRLVGPSLRAWIRRTTRELIIAPLRSGEDVSGLLAVGRWSEGYSDEDVDLAAQCADFFGPIVGSDRLVRTSHWASSHEDVSVDEAEGSLTGS